MEFKYLSSNPDVLGGKPCIKGTRISVDIILEWIANGADKKDILKNYPQINEKAFAEALLYAAFQSKNEILLQSNLAG